ncbi:MAG TPA: BTAD domain-containing putative transcriptional regulator [Micromonosporaceae bacterium]|nr:BTAD domain-containing putative transcriptional regulator [Micromonosporaceae bacterium]
MEFQLLGDVRAVADGRPVPLGRRHERCLLGLLLTEVGHPVSVERLADLLWDGQPSANARGTIQTYVARLRRALAGTGVRITGGSGGYLVDVPPETIDLHRFRAGVVAAAGEPDPARRARLLREALSLWKGPLFGDVGIPALRARVGDPVAESRLAAVEMCAEADLAAGRPERLVALLSVVAVVPPVRERLVALLMIGYEAAGRRAEALSVYQAARRVLIDELGIEPGAELQALHVRILRDGAAPDPAVNGSATRVTVPRELPPAAGAFTGRRAERERMAKVLRGGVPTAGRARVVVVHGMGGVGKSALAVQVAHDVAEDFPDGQVYVDLSGSTPGLRPRTAHEAVTQSLRSLGIRPADMPTDAAEAAGRLRSLTGGKRMLFVLDNAPDPVPVRPLIPAASGCAVLVTSRDPLGSLAADLHLALTGLDDADAHRLLERSAGRMGGDTDACRQIVEACEHLPLALGIAGARLRNRPDLAVEALAARLRDQRHRLDELDVEGLAVRGSIQVTYDALVAAADPVSRLARRSFVRLPLLALPDVPPEWVAALVGLTDVAEVRPALDLLVDLHLLHAVPGGRYGQHDLVRLYAAECAERELTPEDRHAAVERGLAFYVAGSAEVCRLVAANRIYAFPEFAPRPDLPTPVMDSAEDAVAWVGTELANILVAAEEAVAPPAAHAPFPFLVASALTWTLGKCAEFTAARELAGHGVSGARLGTDPWRLAEALKLAGWTEVDLGNHGAARDLLGQALRVSRDAGDPRQTVAILNNLSRAELLAGEDELALRRLVEAQGLLPRVDSEIYEHVTQLNLSNVYASRGDWGRAVPAIEASLAAARRADDIPGLAILLPARGSVLFQLGRYDEALEDFADGLVTSRAVGNGVDEWLSVIGLAMTRLATGETRAALRHAVTAARMRAATRPYERVVTLRVLAKIVRRAGRSGIADDLQRRADEAYARYPGYLEPATEAMLAYQG